MWHDITISSICYSFQTNMWQNCMSSRPDWMYIFDTYNTSIHSTSSRASLYVFNLLVVGGSMHAVSTWHSRWLVKTNSTKIYYVWYARAWSVHARLARNKYWNISKHIIAVLLWTSEILSKKRKREDLGQGNKTLSATRTLQTRRQTVYISTFLSRVKQPFPMPASPYDPTFIHIPY